MTRRLLAAAAAALALWAADFRATAPASASAATPALFDAACRVSTASGSVGSGCVFDVNRQWADAVLVLTAAHVLGSEPTAACEFWRAGHQSRKLPAQVLAADRQIDAAILIVPARAFGGILPAAIPLGTAADNPPAGATIRSVGCASGSWATGFEGRVLQNDSRGNLWFVPPPAGGRSGSALTNAAGDRIVGLLQVRAQDNSHGGATNIATLRARLDPQIRTAAATFRPHETLVAYLAAQCGPNQDCQPFGGRAILPWNASPRRQQPAPAQPAPGAGPWPTMPLQPAPAPAPVDLSPILDSLGRIAGRIDNLQQPTQAPAAADPRIDQALGLASQAHQRLETLVPTVQKLGEAIEQTRGLISDSGSLRQRLAAKRAELEEDGETPSRFEVFRAVMAERDKKHWWIVGLVVAGLGLIIWDVRQKIKTGDPLAIEKAAGFLRRRAADSVVPGLGVAAGLTERAADQIARRVEALENRLHRTTLSTPPPGTGPTPAPNPGAATPAAAPA